VITMNARLGIGFALMLLPATALAQVHTKQVLVGYKCMMLAQQWSGEGPMPPPVPVYGGPDAGAQQVGIAGGTVIVPVSTQPVDGRVSMIFPNGRKVWIEASENVPWHAKADPSATCRPVLLSNGRYGTDGGH
jgi:hypothetical protein